MQEIKEFRKKQGWTQKQIAEYLGIPTITYVQWENGSRKAPQYVLDLIKYKLKNNPSQNKTVPNEKEQRTIFIVHDKKDSFHSETIAKNEYEIKRKREQLLTIWGKHYDEYVTEKLFIEV